MILLIDNYDSFSYNVYQLLGVTGKPIIVKRNDEITAEEISAMDVEALIISPGPGRPEKAGNCFSIIQSLYKKIPILGICLGEQAVAASLGGKVTYAKSLMHGKQDTIHVIREDSIFGKLRTFKAARYHSLAVEEKSLPEDLLVLAKSEDDEVMAIRHKTYPVYGFQFHPESVMTPAGEELIMNFFKITGGENND